MDKILETIKGLLNLDALPEGDDFSGLSTEQLQDALSKASTEFSTANDAKEVAKATEFHAAVKAIGAELATRAKETEKTDKALAKMASEVSEFTKSDPDPSDPPADPDPETPPVDPDTSPAPEPVVTASAPSAAAAPAPATPEPVPAPSAPPAPATPKVEILASAGLDSHSAGSRMEVADLAEEFVKRGHAVKGSRMGAKSKVAEIVASYPEDRILSRDDPAHVTMQKVNPIIAEAWEATYKRNQEIVACDSRDSEALNELTAAGGLCAPVNVRYDICQQGSDVRPLRDSLVRFNANRGGIQFISPPSLADVVDSAQVITAEQDATGYEYPKDCIRVECGDPVEVTVEAISLCMEVGNFTNLSYPELFRAWWGYGQVWHSRVAETELWDGMCALSATRDATNRWGTGAARTTLSEIERYAEQLRYAYRIAPTTPLRLWAPSWLKAVLRTDLRNQMPGDSAISVSDAQLVRYFAEMNIAVTFVLDGQDPGDADEAFPTQVVVILALEGTFLFLDMGTLNFGTEIRDFTLIRQNDVGAFMETFENVAAVCNGPQCITLPICPNGATVGTVEPEECVYAA